MQILGRGLRPAPGLEGKADNDRTDWIRQSTKPDCLVLDFTYNTGRHSVISALDAVSDGRDQKVIDRARQIVQNRDGIISLEQALAEAERDEKESVERKEAMERKRKAAIQVGKVVLETQRASLIGLGGTGQAGTEQRGIDPGHVQAMVDLRLPLPGDKDFDASMRFYNLLGLTNTREVVGYIQAAKDRKSRGLCSVRQYLMLHKKYKVSPNLTMKQAGQMISRMKGGW